MSKLGHGAIATYSKNLLRSSSDILLDWIKSTQLVQIVGDEVVSAKKARELEGDITPKEKIKKLTKNQIESFVKNYEDETGINLPEDLKKSFRNTIKSIKTGDLNIKDEAYDEFYEDDDIRALFKELDIAYESHNYFKGGNKLMKLYELKNENLKKLRIRANGESMEVQGPIPEVNNEIIEIKDDIIALDNEAASNEDIDSTYTMNVDNTVNDLKGRIFDLMDKTSGVKELAVSYKDAFADSLIALLSVKSNFDLNVADRPAEEVLNNTETLAAEITEKTNNDDKINDRVEEVKEVTSTDADSLIFNPVIDATAQEVTGEEPVPAAEDFKDWLKKKLNIKDDVAVSYNISTGVIRKVVKDLADTPEERVEQLSKIYADLADDIHKKNANMKKITVLTTALYGIAAGIGAVMGGIMLTSGDSETESLGAGAAAYAVTGGIMTFGLVKIGQISGDISDTADKAVTNATLGFTGISSDYIGSLKKLRESMMNVGKEINKGVIALNKAPNLTEADYTMLDVLDKGLNKIKSDIELLDKDIAVIEAKLAKEKNPTAQGEGIKDVAAGVAKNAGAAASVVAVATLLIAIPVNLAIQKRNIKNESKFKSNFTFKQPLVASDQISAEFVSKYAKAIEVKSLIEAKALIESSIATADGGSIVSRASRNNMLTPANITPKNIELFKKAPINYDELMATFSEAKPFIKKLNTDSLFLVPSLSSVVRRHAESFKVITDIKVPEASGEAGSFLATGRNAHPTYLDIEVSYKDPSDLTKLGGGTNTKKSTLGFHVIPRTLKSTEILTTLKEMGDFEDMKVLNGERESQKKLSNVIKFWKKKGTNNEKAVLSSNSFSAIIDKIENVKNPLFHLMLSYGEYMDLKDNGKIDLMNRETYKKIISKMPIISISIIDEERDIVYLSEGPYMSYTKHDGSDFIDSISQYEKDLKTIIKYNQYQ
jgi:ribosomal protein L17